MSSFFEYLCYIVSAILAILKLIGIVSFSWKLIIAIACIPPIWILFLSIVCRD